MKVAIDISPLKSGHKVRGVGQYVEELRNSLIKNHSDQVFIFYDKKLDEKAELIHYPYFDPFVRSLPLFSMDKFVVTVHDLIPILFPEHFPGGVKGNLIWKIQKRSLLRAKRIITDSESSKKDIAAKLGFDESKIDVVYLGASDVFKKLEIGNWKLNKNFIFLSNLHSTLEMLPGIKIFQI